MSKPRDDYYNIESLSDSSSNVSTKESTEKVMISEKSESTFDLDKIENCDYVITEDLVKINMKELRRLMKLMQPIMNPRKEDYCKCLNNK